MVNTIPKKLCQIYIGYHRSDQLSSEYLFLLNNIIVLDIIYYI